MEAQKMLHSFIAGQSSYDVEREIGYGTYSEVHLGRDHQSGASVALKEMFLTENKTIPEHIERELDVLRSLDHPNIIPLLDVKCQGFGITLVFPLCKMDLAQLLGRKRLPPAIAKAVLRQCFAGIAALHASGFMHRDLAPANVLLGPSGGVYVGDFGQARKLAVGEEQRGDLTPAVGTRWYRSPELLFGARRYTPAVDVWSLGMLTAHVLAGQPLCAGSSDIDQICRIQDALGTIDEDSCLAATTWPDYGKLLFPPAPGRDWSELLPDCDAPARQLCQALLCFDPDARWTAAQALKAEYFCSGETEALPEQVAEFVNAL